MLLALPIAGRKQTAETLLNVSYDPTRELYKDLGARFIVAWKAKEGGSVAIRTSYGGSGAQARAVLGGVQLITSSPKTSSGGRSIPWWRPNITASSTR